MVEEGRRGGATFIDYKDAFSSTNQEYMILKMRTAGVSAKVCRMLRKVYEKANGCVRLGELSDTFPIRRGTVQGDIYSPVVFCVALAAIFNAHDNKEGGITLGGIRIDSAFYADDAALIDEEHDTGASTLCTRMSEKIHKLSWREIQKIVRVNKLVVPGIRTKKECVYPVVVRYAEQHDAALFIQAVWRWRTKRDIVGCNSSEEIFRRMCSLRLSAIAKGSREDALMIIKIPKTKYMPIGKREAACERATEAEMHVLSKSLKFKCKMCGQGYGTHHAARVHEGKCQERDDAQILKERGMGCIVDSASNEGGTFHRVQWEGHEDRWISEIAIKHSATCEMLDTDEETDDKDTYEVEKMMDVRGVEGKREYLVQWRGYTVEENTWEPNESFASSTPLCSYNGYDLVRHKLTEREREEHLCAQIKWSTAITASGKVGKGTPATGCMCDRCPTWWADRTAVRAHAKGCRRKRQLKGAGSLTARLVKHDKHKKLLATRKAVTCEGQAIETVSRFKYLGHLLCADGETMAAIQLRLAQASAQFRKQYVLYRDKALSVHIRLRIYVACVCSVLRYSCEAWRFDAPAQRLVNGFNAHCTSVITGRSYEETANTPPVDLVGQIRQQRLVYAGHVLRYENYRMTKQVMVEYFRRYSGGRQAAYPKGSILEDAPPHASVEELLELAADREGWRGQVLKLKGKLGKYQFSGLTSQELRERRPAMVTAGEGPGPPSTELSSSRAMTACACAPASGSDNGPTAAPMSPCSSDAVPEPEPEHNERCDLCPKVLM